jgi:hypothetical protein
MGSTDATINHLDEIDVPAEVSLHARCVIGQWLTNMARCAPSPHQC